jgi:nucleoside 2-deoxyribosyltransferase
VIAHVTPFRGPSCDVGTAYEMGFARALGLRVFAYSNVTDDFTARSSRAAGARPRADGGLEDREQMQIETFGLADNLMLIGAVEDSGGTLVTVSAAKEQLYTQLAGFEACLAAAREAFGGEG